MRRVPLALLLSVAAGCSSSPPDVEPAAPPTPTPAADPAGRYELRWGTAISVFDALPRSEDALAAVAVATRDSGTRSAGAYDIPTRCDAAACVDGLREAASLEVLIADQLADDEREALAGDGDGGGWLERGLAVRSVAPDTISVLRATAWLSPGAARSNGALSCETYARGGRYRLRLADAIGPAAARRLVADVEKFLRESRETDGRASELGDHDADSFLLDEAGVLTFCLEHVVGASTGHGVVIEARPR